MTRDKWQAGYSAVRAWRHGHIGEQEYYERLRSLGITRHALQIMRVYSWRLYLYQNDPLKRSRARIRHKQMMIGARIDKRREDAERRVWLDDQLSPPSRR